MARLQSVYLDFNRLSGSLPKDWIRLGSGNLQQIILNDNLLTGEVPGRSKTRQSLKAIQLQHNSFRKIGKELCGLSIFAGGALAVLQADCGVCECDYFCNSSRCVG